MSMMVREAVKSLYPGSWPNRVDHMKYSQIHAIYCKNFDKDGKRIKKEKQPDLQISIWDLGSDI